MAAFLTFFKDINATANDVDHNDVAISIVLAEFNAKYGTVTGFAALGLEADLKHNIVNRLLTVDL